MRPFALLLLVPALPLVACASEGVARVQEQTAPAPAPALAEHRWLQQLVGTWEVEAQATMGPDAEPMTMHSTESVRAVGALWVLSEGRSELGGEPFTSWMTLGYDPAQQAFVGTWLDSMSTHLWVYRGALDASGTKLTLDTEGPSWDDPARTCRFRDAFEILAPDHKRLTSSMQAPDGTWTTFLHADYRRER